MNFYTAELVSNQRHRLLREARERRLATTAKRARKSRRGRG
jgi:hypothetical protein